MREFNNFPRQNLPYTKKNKEWRESCVKWAKNASLIDSSLVRKTIAAKKLNYDLINGKASSRDMVRVLNPHSLKASYIPEDIQHYPILNSKLNVLRGEESARVFDYKVIVTNPNAISEIEEQKKQQILQQLTELIQNTAQSEEEYQKEIEKLSDFYTYSWQDLREVRGNYFLKHYEKELSFPMIFNQGFMDAMIVGEEIYRCDIVSGEPTLERIDPMKIRVFKSGNSNRIEDADIVVIEDYWSPSKVIDTFHEDLSEKDVKKIEEGIYSEDGSLFDDERNGFINAAVFDEHFVAGDAVHTFFSDLHSSQSNLPYDEQGNVRVLQVYWKSRRKLKKVRFLDTESGTEYYDLLPEDFVIDEFLGQEEKILWVNEAWEGTLIGNDIFINIRPRPVQYNRLSNPSKCHFGIIGSIYNLNGDKPFSLVDIMKPYSYLYNVIHDRLNKAIADNWGKIITMDLAKIPKGWDPEKWMHHARINKIAVVDSFKEGNIGAATGKIAGGLNNNTSGVIDAEMGNLIQSYINLLEYIKNEMSEAIGISKQREGQIQNRETVGGVERSTLQSSHITEWIFFIHEDLKKRTLECFLETAKLALRGSSMKFQNILPDSSRQISSIDGDEFAEADYGLLVDSSKHTQELSQKMDMLAQAALQNQILNFSTIMKLYSTASIAEKIKYVEKNEEQMQQQQQEQQKAQQEQFQQQMKMQEQQRKEEMQLKDDLNARDNDTKILVASLTAQSRENMNSENNYFRLDDDQYSEEEKEDMARKKHEFAEKMKLEKDKLALQERKVEADIKKNNNKK